MTRYVAMMQYKHNRSQWTFADNINADNIDIAAYLAIRDYEEQKKDPDSVAHLAGTPEDFLFIASADAKECKTIPMEPTQ